MELNTFLMIVVDTAFIPLALGLGSGAGFGALSAFMGYIKDKQVFDNQRFLYGILTGIFTGLGAALLLQDQLIKAETASQLLGIIAGIGVAVIAIDTGRTTISGSIHAREQEIKSGTT